MAKKWIQKTGMKKGALHRKLGVPEGEKIPASKLEAAKHSSDPTERREANLAETLKGFHGRNDTRLDPRGAEIHTIHQPENEQFVSWKYDRGGRAPLHQALEEGTAKTPRNPYIDY